MKKDENSYIKLGLEKDPSSGKLLLNIRFNHNAPNFSTDKEWSNWSPSIEEWSYANEAFEILSKGQNQKQIKKSITEQSEVELEEDFISQTNEHKIVDKFLEKNK